jgi:hypothetical protein
VGVGVKVTEVPVQIEVADAAILTAGVREVFTIMVTGLEVAVGVEGQAAVVVITQDTTSPLFKVEVI